MNLPEEWMLCNQATVESLGKLNNGWIDNLDMSQKNPDRNRIVGCAHDADQMAQVIVRWTKRWLPRIFVPLGGISAAGDNVEAVPLPSTGDTSVTADNIDRLKPDEQEWFFGILTRSAERELMKQYQGAKLVNSNHKPLPNGHEVEFVGQFHKDGVWFESKDLWFLPKHEKRILALSWALPLAEKKKYQVDLEAVEANFRSSIEEKERS